MKISEKKKIALVLSGGGMKAAAFHIGVCLALREKGFQFSGGLKDGSIAAQLPNSMQIQIYVGSSAGAIICTFLAAGYSIDSVINAFIQGADADAPLIKTKSTDGYLRPISYRDIFNLNIQAGYPTQFLRRLFKKTPVISGGLEVLLKRGFKMNGIFKMDSLEKYLRTHVVQDNEFKKLLPELYIVATQLNHSRKVIFGPYDSTTKTNSIKYAGYAKISEACAASASLPPFFSPFPVTNHEGKSVYFYDGEIRDTLSTHVAADHGADLVIASYSIQPYHYNEEMGSLHDYGIPIIFNQALYQTVQQKIERHIKHQKNTRSMINAVVGYLREAKIDETHIEKLVEILIQRSKFNPKVDYIYIHPSPQDHQFFFADHFSLNPKVLREFIRTGFRSAMLQLRKLNY